MRVYSPMRVDAFSDPAARRELHKVNTFLRQVSTQFARTPSYPQGSAPASPGGSLNLNDYLYLPGRVGGQESKGRVTFQTKSTAANGTTQNPTQTGFGFRAVGTTDGQMDVNVNVEEKATGFTKLPIREWVFPAFNQTSDQPSGLSFFVDADNYQRVTRKSHNGSVWEVADTAGEGFATGRGSGGGSAQTFNVLFGGGYPTCTWPHSAAGNIAINGTQPMLYVPGLDYSGASSGGAQVTRDKTHVFGIVKVKTPSGTTPFEDAGMVYGGGTRKELYCLAGRAIGTYTGPGDGDLPVWHASVTTTGNFHVSSAVVDGIPDTSGMTAGQRVRMTSNTSSILNEDVFITSVDSGTQITLSENAAADSTGASFITFGPTWLSQSALGASIDHGTLLGLTDDDHSQYLLLAGRAGGQVLGNSAHSGGDTEDLSIEGRVQIGDANTSYTAGRFLNVFANLVNSGFIFANIQGLLTNLSGTGAGTWTGLGLTMSGTPTWTSGSANWRAFFVTMSPTAPAGVNYGSVSGGIFQVAPNESSTGRIDNATGLQVNALLPVTTTNPFVATSLIGHQIRVNNRARNVTDIYGCQIENATGSLTGTVTNFFGYILGSRASSSVPENSLNVTNWYGFYLENTTLLPTNTWGIWIGPSVNNVINGKVRIGNTTDPSHLLHLAAGTSSVAPIVLTSGTSLTTPVAGAIEFTTDDFFATITTGPARKAFVLDDGTRLTSGRVPFATTNGRLTDDSDMTFATDTLTVTKIVASTSLAVGGGSALTVLDSGTYTPTLTNVANLDASTAYQCQWMQVGATVTVSGKVDIDPTLAAISTQLGISLPVASNIGAAEDVAGTAFSPTIAGQGAAILGDATNNRAQMEWISGDMTNQPMYFTFTYQVI